MEVAIFLLVFFDAVIYFICKQAKREGYSVFLVLLTLILYLLLNIR